MSHFLCSFHFMLHQLCYVMSLSLLFFFSLFFFFLVLNFGYFIRKVKRICGKWIKIMSYLLCSQLYSIPIMVCNLSQKKIYIYIYIYVCVGGGGYVMCINFFFFSILKLCLFFKESKKEYWASEQKSSFFFFLQTNTHTHAQERGKWVLTSNTKTHHKFHSKTMVTFKGGWGELYYT